MSRLTRLVVLTLVFVGLPVVPFPQGQPDLEHRTWSLHVGEEPVEAPDRFSLVGISWTNGAPAPEGVRVRTSTDGKRWTDWTELHVHAEEGPDPGTREAGPPSTEPLWVGEARHVDVQWPGTGRPPGARVEVVDPGPDPVRPSLRTATAATNRPPIVTRSGWGADESIRRCCPRYTQRLKVAFVHHTATTNNYSREESDDIVRAIYAYHVKTNGWDDIGYNFLVDRYGRVFEGRAGGMARSVIGAHARGFNTGSTGVATLGSFDSTNPPQAALDALDRLLAWKLDVHHVKPDGTTTMRSGGSNRYPEGQQVELRRISGHRDVGHTSCPGGHLYDDLGSIRHDATAIGLPKIYNPRASPSVVTPDGNGKKDKTVFTARLSGSLDWTAGIRNARNETVRAFSGSGDSVRFSWNGTNGRGEQVPYGHYRVHLEAGNARPADVPVAVWRYDRPLVGADGTEGGPGYWLVADDGAVLPAGTARSHGSMAGRPLAAPVVDIAGTGSDEGYWLAASDGGIFTFGDAKFKGSMGGVDLVEPVVGMTGRPSGNGYWMVASDGGVFTFGDAKFKGSMGGVDLVEPVVGMAAHPSGNGYWLVASDGGIFTFGSARFHGSMGGTRLVAPVVGMAPTASGNGYWMVAADGGIFTFGDARFHGSMGGERLSSPVVAMAATSTGGGYWLITRGGNVHAFGDAQSSGVIPPL